MFHGSSVLASTGAARCSSCGRVLVLAGYAQPERLWTQRNVAVNVKRRGGGSEGSLRGRRPLLVTVDPYGSDIWRLDPIIQLLREGAVCHLVFIQPSTPSKLIP